MPADSLQRRPGPETWLWTFLNAATLAGDQVVCLTSEISEVQARYRQQIAARKSTQGVRNASPTDSATSLLL